MQNCRHTATCYFLPTVSKNGKIVFFQFFLWRLIRRSWLAAVVNSLWPQGSRNVDTNSANEMSEHLKNDGRHTASRIHFRQIHTWEVNSGTLYWGSVPRNHLKKKKRDKKPKALLQPKQFSIEFILTKKTTNNQKPQLFTEV